MALIEIRAKNARGKSQRIPLAEALDIEDKGASPRGSTYYKTFQHCPREFYLSYKLGWAPAVPSDSLTTGLLWHHCLELYYRAIMEHQRGFKKPEPSNPDYLWGGANEGAAEAYRAIDKVNAVEGYPEIAGVCRRMLDAYLDQFDRVDRIRVLASEETLQYMDVEPYTCRLDLLVEDYERGGMWVWEHKSARMLTQDLLSMYDMDLQILGEVFLIENVLDLSQFPPLRGVVVNITTKPQTAGSTVKVHRHDVCPSPAHIKMFEHTIGTRTPMLKTAEVVGWPRWLGNCSGAARGYSRCEFYDLCHDFPALGVKQLHKANVEDFPGYVAKRGDDGSYSD